MVLDHIMQVWPLLVIVGFLTVVGFMRMIAHNIGQQVKTHNIARKAVRMRQEYARHRQEQLERQRELMRER